MDEQRLRAYLSLIQELLDCPSGEENQIFSQHPELIDGTFVQVCEQMAEQLQSNGQENVAGFLRNLAQQVGEYLNSQAHPTSNQYLAILEEIFSAEIESDSDPKVVYPILEKHQDQLDLNFAETLTQWFQSANDNYESLRDLFWCQKKIVATYQKAKESYQTARELYSKLEKNVPKFYTISNETPEQRLNSLDTMVQEIPQDLLYYNCCLRDLKTHYTTIKTNSDNFKTSLNFLLEAGNKLDVWSRLAEKTYPLYLRQIETYLEYLEPGKDLFSDLINTIRAKAEIEQAKNNQDLQDHIQSIGVGIAAGAIIASTSGLMTAPWSPPTRDNWIKSFPLPPFIIALLLSTFCSWGAWKLMKWRIESQRKRSLKSTSQKPALKTDESGIYKS
ncbi:hypothetical protein NO108_02064 [Planktothrix rubescens]|nr:hypothetical protein NO108_02064 [Planktothrix rubescens]